MTEARQRLTDLLGGYRRTALVHLAAELSIADHLAGRAATSAELAETVGARPEALHQVLRALAGIGVLRHTGDDRFALTEVGELLRSTAPGSMHGAAVYFGALSYRAYTGLLDAVRHGGVAFERVFGTGYYDHLDQHPRLAGYYHQMIALPRGTGAVLAGLFDFTAYHTIVDVGGGNGSLLAELISLLPHAKGVVYELALSAPSVAEVLSEWELGDRCVFVPGDFRESVPPGGDVYLLSRVLANWADADAVRILANCRAAMLPGARLVIFEMVMPSPVTEGAFPVEGDLNALAHFGGAVRSRAEFDRILTAAGFGLRSLTPVGPGVPWSLIECEVRA
ncbi:methyltransferase [Actinophytocola sp.]|uniref:methyltransferase n=1 Tax=Actinophytocola sp. TaxID=1872138 RepID=UPI002D7FB04E|nr:methyltransferase [Actinophytocola sp.]HET9143892.1 methyltransferase [Actinophytocola sp.]